MAVCLQAKVRECGLGLWPRLFADSVCDTQRRCYSIKCYAFTFYCCCVCVCVCACVRACVIRLTCQLRAQRVRPCQLQVLRNRSSLACPTPNGRQFLLFQTNTQLPRSNSRCHFFNIGFVVRPVVQYYSWNLLLRSSITQGQVDYEQDVIALSLTTISTKKRVI